MAENRTAVAADVLYSRGVPGPRGAFDPQVFSEVLDLAGSPLFFVGFDRVIRGASSVAEECLGGDLIGRTCCEVLGCRTPSASWVGCLTENVLRSGQSTNLERIDEAPRTGRPVWVEAHPNGDSAAGAVAVHVETARDGPRPPEVPGPLALRICALGPVVVKYQGQTLRGDWLDQRPGLLLKYLVARRGREAPVDEIAEALWPHLGAAGAARVRHSVHLLRKHLQFDDVPDLTGSVIVTHKSSYALDTNRLWLDVAAFEQAVRKGVEAYATGANGDAERELLYALRLYRDDFLVEDAYADWALDERERLRALLDAPLRLLIEMRLRRGRLSGAARYAERLAHLNPLDGDAQELLLRIWLRQGRRTRAQRHYEIFAARTLRELGEKPAFDLASLNA